MAASDLDAIKQRQRATWASGDYGTIGIRLQLVGELLCETLDVRAGWKALDVAAGNGICSLAAARRGCEVTSTDYVLDLLAQGRGRAAAERLPIRFAVADAEKLAFPDASFDLVLSSFGVMFAPDQAGAAAELARVCRSGGRIGLANWTPNGFAGRMFGVVGRHVPPPPGLVPPTRWGTQEYLEQLFGRVATDIRATPRHFVLRYRSPEHWLEVFRRWFGPMHRAFAALQPDGQDRLATDLLALVAEHNRSGDGTMVVPSEYLEVVVVRR